MREEPKYIQCRVCGHTTDHYDKDEACLSEPAEFVVQEVGSPIDLGPWDGCSNWGYNVEGLFKYKGSIAKMARIRTNMCSCALQVIPRHCPTCFHPSTGSLPFPTPFTEDEIRDSLMINNQPEGQ